jgi:hypothetical protein
MVAAVAILTLTPSAGSAAARTRSGGAAHAGDRPAAAQRTRSDQSGAPKTIALANVDVVTGARATVTYRVEDAAAPAATVTIVVTGAHGAAVTKLQPAEPVATGKDLSFAFPCTLKPGYYHYRVNAVDSLGVADVSARPARLRVLPVFPEAASIARAVHWLRTRQSAAGFAVIDDRGVLRGYHLNETFASASVVKAMLLVDYLRAHATISAGMRNALARMIIVSDNAVASSLFGALGDRGLYSCARLVGMTRFAVDRNWALARITAADQARLFFSMDSFVPLQYQGWVRYLFSHITRAHCWGIPEVARPAGWKVFFKGGYMPIGNGIVVHEASRLERDGVTFGFAILTAGRESLAYGAATLRGVTARVLAGERSKPISPARRSWPLQHSHRAHPL